MATISYALDRVCAGGGHAHVSVSLNGGLSQHFAYTMDELRAPLSALTQDERELAALVIAKLHLAGMSKQQARNAIQAGFTVTI